MSKFLRAVSKDYMRGVVISLISTAIVIPLGCVLIFIPLWLVTQFDTNIWVLIISAALFLLILFGGGFSALALTLYRRKRWLDAVFTPLGLSGSAYMISGRQYQGTVDGREVTARFYRGPTLELYVGTPLQTRLGIAEKTKVGLALAGVFQRQPLSLEDPDLEGLSVFALDEDWARSLLSDPKAKVLLLRLMQAGESWTLMQQVHLRPGTFLLRLYRNKNLFRYSVAPEEAREWLDDMLALARIAEALPAPQMTAEETSAERLVRTGRTTSIALIIVAAFLGIPVCLAVILAAVFLLIASR
jgi:hypothetical protein